MVAVVAVDVVVVIFSQALMEAVVLWMPQGSGVAVQVVFLHFLVSVSGSLIDLVPQGSVVVFAEQVYSTGQLVKGKPQPEMGLAITLRQ